MNREVLSFIGRQHEPAVMYADRRKQKRVRHAAAITASEPWRQGSAQTWPFWSMYAIFGAALALHLALFGALLLMPSHNPQPPRIIPVQMVTSIPKPEPAHPAAKPAAKPAPHLTTRAAKPAPKQPPHASKPIEKPAARALTHPAPKLPHPAPHIPEHDLPRPAGHMDGTAKFVAASIFNPAGNPHLFCPPNAGPNAANAIVSLDILITPQNGRDQPVYPQVSIIQSSGNPAIDNAAQTIIEKWRYTPKIENGKPVPWETEQTAQPCAE